MTEITRLIEPNSLIWIVGFEPRRGISSRDFIEAWKDAAGSRAPGVVRRELYRQVPEWTARAAEEM